VPDREPGDRVPARLGDPNGATRRPSVGDEEEPFPPRLVELLQAALSDRGAVHLADVRDSRREGLVSDPRDVVGDHLSPLLEKRLDRPLELRELGDQEQPWPRFRHQRSVVLGMRERATGTIMGGSPY
jgi:hypothetical protein